MSFINAAAPSAPSSIFEIARATAAASPLLTRSLRLFVGEGILCFLCLLWLKGSQDLTGDDDALDLGGPFSDRAELRVAPVFLRRIVFRVPVPAVDLDRLLANLHTHL